MICKVYDQSGRSISCNVCLWCCPLREIKGERGGREDTPQDLTRHRLIIFLPIWKLLCDYFSSYVLNLACAICMFHMRWARGQISELRPESQGRPAGHT